MRATCTVLSWQSNGVLAGCGHHVLQQGGEDGQHLPLHCRQLSEHNAPGKPFMDMHVIEKGSQCHGSQGMHACVAEGLSMSWLTVHACLSSRRALNVMAHSACMPVLQKEAASSHRCWLPVQKLQPSGPSNGSLGISAQYSLAEHYLGAFTPVAERLLLGSTQGLEQAHLLADHRVSHAIILCCGPEVSRLTTIPAFLSSAFLLRSITWAHSPYGRAPAVGIHPRAWSRRTCWQINGSPLPSFSAVL